MYYASKINNMDPEPTSRHNLVILLDFKEKKKLIGEQGNKNTVLKKEKLGYLFWQQCFRRKLNSDIQEIK